jgi:hypothetical protein
MCNIPLCPSRTNSEFHFSYHNAGGLERKFSRKMEKQLEILYHVTLLQCSSLWQRIKFEQSHSHQFYKSHSVQLLYLSKTQHRAKNSSLFICRRHSTMQQLVSQPYQKKYARGVPSNGRIARRSVQGVFKRPNILNSMPTSTESALWLLSTPSVRY